MLGGLDFRFLASKSSLTRRTSRGRWGSTDMFVRPMPGRPGPGALLLCPSISSLDKIQTIFRPVHRLHQ